jgi:CubicO group peptidase (beta-lactamase class C family)
VSRRGEVHVEAIGSPAGKVGRLATCYQADPGTGVLEVFDPVDGQWSRPPVFPDGGAGLVSTVGDYLAFGQMMLNKGKLGSERILSRPAVELMTSDQLTPEQKAKSGSWGDGLSWAFGMSVVDPARRAFPALSPVYLGFWTSVYQAIDD